MIFPMMMMMILLLLLQSLKNENGVQLLLLEAKAPQQQENKPGIRKKIVRFRSDLHLYQLLIAIGPHSFSHLQSQRNVLREEPNRHFQSRQKHFQIPVLLSQIFINHTKIPPLSSLLQTIRSMCHQLLRRSRLDTTD